MNFKQDELFPNTNTQQVIQGDCLEVMRGMEENSIDFVVTDPPYGLHFMGKGWDKFKKSNFDESGDHKHLENASVDGRSCNVRSISTGNSHAGTYDENRNDEFQEFMRVFGIEALRVLKPGGMVAMFGAPRRHHRQMSGLEDAGFEIRDVIAWIFGSGFPKSHNFGRKLGNEWDGYGTALKPAYEPIIICMKPLDGTFAHNAEKWGVAGINVDASRIKHNEECKLMKKQEKINSIIRQSGRFEDVLELKPNGRWPANLILSEEAAEELDQMTGVSKSIRSKGRNGNNVDSSVNLCAPRSIDQERGYNDSGGASRFFYCAKASSSERNRGLEKPSTHPTVKPIALMKYILKLLAPPDNPICLDPFAGSGSTLVAAKELDISCIGIEKELEYCEIANRRII